jgi:excisionase family DNA binding protein
MASSFTIIRICGHCAKEFTAQKTTTKYCSHKCGSRAYKVRTRNGKIAESNKETEQIKAKPLNTIKEQEFLNVSEVSQLIRLSKRTIYRLIARGELQVYKIGKRTIFKRTDIDNLFQTNIFTVNDIKNNGSESNEIIEPVAFNENEYVCTRDIQKKYGLSDNGLRAILKRKGVKTVRKGIYAYVHNADIVKIFN